MSPNPPESPSPHQEGASPETSLRWRKAAVRLLFSLVLLSLLLFTLDREVLVETLGRFWREAPEVWAFGVVGFLFWHAVGAMKWRFFLSLCGARIGRRQALRFYAAGLFANLCLPSLIGGDVLRAGLACSATEEREAVLLGSVLDRLADLFTLGLFVGAGALAVPSALETMESAAIDGPQIVGGFFLTMLVGLVGLAILVRGLPRESLPPAVAKALDGLASSFQLVRSRPLRMLVGIGWCASVQAGFIAVNVMLARALDFAMDLSLWFLLWPLAKIAAMMPVSLGGLGVREGAFRLLVEPFGLEGAQAAAQALVWDTVLIAGGLVAGLFWVLVRPRVGETLSSAARGVRQGTG